MATAPTTLERLRVFHSIAVTGSIAAAARSLGYTPSAVSQHLSTLEREVGVALVERSNRGIALTAAGHELVPAAVELLDLVQNSVAQVRAVADDQVLPITVAAFPTAVTSLLLPMVDRMPTLRIVAAESEPAMAALGARAVDAAIVDGDAVAFARGESVDRVLLRAESVWLVGPAGSTSSDLLTYRDAPWVLGGAETRLGRAARSACRAVGFEPRMLVETEDHHVAFDAIRAGGAIAMLPELALNDMPEDVVVLRGDAPVFGRRIEFVTRHPVADNPSLALLVEALAVS